jgi:hypothetical protein
MSRRSAIFLYFRSDFDIKVAASLGLRDIDRGKSVTVIDMTRFTIPSQGAHRGGWVENLDPAGNRSLRAFFGELGINFVRPQTVSRLGFDKPLPDEKSVEIQESLLSTLQTELRDDLSSGLTLTAKVFRWVALRRAQAGFRALATYFEQNPVDTVHVFNGRTISSRLQLLASKGIAAEVKYWEQFDFPGKYYSGDFSPHDRVEMQNRIRKLSRDADASEMHSVAANWFRNRSAPGSTVNPFSSRWESVIAVPGIVSDPTSRNLKATFFTSSTDEVSALGPAWNESKWESQYASFAYLGRFLQERDYELSIRIHPNLLNKSLSNYSREISHLSKLSKEFPQLKVHLPSSKVNTYHLISDSNLVVVANSTVGLEASLLGVPVVCTNSSYFDDIAGVLKVHSPTSIEGYLDGPQDPSLAESWVYGLSKCVFDLDPKAEAAFSYLDRRRSFISSVFTIFSTPAIFTLYLEAVARVRKWYIINILEPRTIQRLG